MDEAYHSTLQRKEYIETQGYKMIEIWECEYENKYPEMKDYIEDMPDQLNARDALYGGRTNAVKLFHEIASDEKIRYIDVCLLYPCMGKQVRYITDWTSRHHPRRFQGYKRI